MALELVVIGHILNETIVFLDRTIFPVLGSPAAYSSVVSSKLGARTGIVTKIGRDMPPQLLEVFKEAGVDTRGMTVGESSTNNLLIYDQKGNKTLKFLTKAKDIFFEDIPADYLDSPMFYVCPIDYEVPLETIRSLREKKEALLAVDLGGYGGATSDSHPQGREQGEQEIKELVGYFDLVKASFEDCRYLLGLEKGSEEQVTQKFVQWGARVGILTLGDRGSVIATKESIFEIPAYPLEGDLDCTGAGDAYAAGFLVEYSRSKDAHRSGLFATVTTSLMIQGSGGVIAKRMPSRDQVLDRMQSFSY
jgi:sugar/nucleoside kinase (ribokinase family)